MVSVRLSVSFISETTKRIMTETGMEGGYIKKFLNEFDFGSYHFSVTSTLHEVQIRLYHFSAKWLIVQNFGT
jgi:hypothetical protein